MENGPCYLGLSRGSCMSRDALEYVQEFQGVFFEDKVLTSQWGNRNFTSKLVLSRKVTTPMATQIKRKQQHIWRVWSPKTSRGNSRVCQKCTLWWTTSLQIASRIARVTILGQWNIKLLLHLSWLFPRARDTFSTSLGKLPSADGFFQRCQTPHHSGWDKQKETSRSQRMWHRTELCK